MTHCTFSPLVPLPPNATPVHQHCTEVGYPDLLGSYELWQWEEHGKTQEMICPCGQNHGWMLQGENTNKELKAMNTLNDMESVARLMASSASEAEWNNNADKVKAANDGDYPSFWFGIIVLSGLAAKTQAKWS